MNSTPCAATHMAPINPAVCTRSIGLNRRWKRAVARPERSTHAWSGELHLAISINWIWECFELRLRGRHCPVSCFGGSERPCQTRLPRLARDQRPPPTQTIFLGFNGGSVATWLQGRGKHIGLAPHIRSSCGFYSGLVSTTACPARVPGAVVCKTQEPTCCRCELNTQLTYAGNRLAAIAIRATRARVESASTCCIGKATDLLMMANRNVG